MASEESRYPADWLSIAERDWKRVDRLLQAGDAELAGFCLQQALEKIFKAFLLFNGWELHRVHDLEVLLNAASAYDSSLEPFRSPCQRITGFYLTERYPFLTESSLTEGDVRASLEQVRELIGRLRVGASDR
jgi:HEPN domain-containing protein